MQKNWDTKPKIKRKGKTYDLDQCALYKLKGHNKLKKLLDVTLKKLKNLARDENYFLQTKKQRNEKIRHIQYPKPALYKVHVRIASLISRIQTPYYLHSGVKNKSHITNANCHRGHHAVLTLDLQNFYQPISKKSVFWFFHNKLKIARDIAGLLAEICTYNGYIPTGSPLSMILAYWASSNMFTSLKNLSEKRNIVMSIYVDDLTFSGTSVDNKFKNNVIQLIRLSGYEIRSSKTRLFKVAAPKLVTGCVLKEGFIYVRNKQLLAIDNLRNTIKNTFSRNKLFILSKKLSGQLLSAGQIDKRYKEIERQLRKNNREQLIMD